MSNKKDKKKARYTKEQLLQAWKDSDTKIVGELVGKLLNRDKLSVAETIFAASAARVSKPEGSICFIDLASIPEAQDFIFRNLYIVYHGDLDGQYGIEKATGLVSIEEKREDIIRLKEYYQDWKLVCSKNNYSDTLLNEVINETSNELRELNRRFQAGEFSQTEFNYKEKAIVLHSKYLYITTKAFFEEHGSKEVVAHFHGNEILINEFSYVHIMNRHLAGGVKQFDTQKSFHSDTKIKWFELPYDLKSIIEELGSHHATQTLDIKYIPFKFNTKLYAIWTEVKKKNGQATSMTNRLQTCYPLEEPAKVEDIVDNYREIIISEMLIAFVPK